MNVVPGIMQKTNSSFKGKPSSVSKEKMDFKMQQKVEVKKHQVDFWW